MDQLHKFLFEGLPVRGMLVRLTSSWQELCRRRDPQQGGSGLWPAAVQSLLGQMSAAGVLMHANIKFDGALILQMQGDGPVPLAVCEVRPGLKFRATATVSEAVAADAGLSTLMNASGRGRCAITLDPQDRAPGQQPYQGVVSFSDEAGEPLQSLSDVLELYMRQSEQLQTRLVLAANDQVAAGLLIQRLPVEGEGNLGPQLDEADPAWNEGFHRIAHLTATLTPEELMTLDPDTVLRRLFWEEDVIRFESLVPTFSCTCSRDRVTQMLLGLGRAEVHSILCEQGEVDIGCDFCGQHYRFDAVDVGEAFTPPSDLVPGSASLN